MKVQLERITPVKVKLAIEVSGEEMAAQEAATLNEIRRSVTVPGFRKGKAPASAIKRLYGGRVQSDVFSEAIKKSYGDALVEHDLHPVDDPDISIEEAPGDGALAYTAVVEVRPTVEPTGYEKLALKREEVRVDETAVETRLDALRQQHASFEPAPEGYEAKAGDMAVVDFLGKIDGVAFEGGAAQGHPLMLGSGRMIPGFEEGVVGAKAGEERTVTVTFPEDYRAEDLAGKAADFEIKVNEIKERRIPEADDELARTAADLETLDELREKIREQLAAEEKNRVEREFRRKLISVLLEANPFEVPEALVARQEAHSTERMRRDLTMRGLDPAVIGLDKPEFLAQARKAAERSVRWAFLQDALATKLGVTVGDAEMDERIQKIAEADGRPAEAVRAYFEKEGHLDALADSIREEMTMEAILKTADIEEVSAEAFAAWRGEDE